MLQPSILSELLAVGDIVQKARDCHLRLIEAFLLRDYPADIRNSVRVLKPIGLCIRMIVQEEAGIIMQPRSPIQ